MSAKRKLKEEEEEGNRNKIVLRLINKFLP
jgi:hypothetical protein